MADNVVIPAQGTGTSTPNIATDDVGGVQHQRVKVEWGADGVATDTSAANPLPVVQTGTPALPTGAATDASVLAGNVLEGAVTETAPASDTASSGLNGRLQRIAQRLTSLIALLPASLGQKTSANSLAVVVASDQSAVPVSGTVTTTPPANASENVAQISGVTPLMGAGNTGTGSLRVTVATDQAVLPVSDNAASLTVDSPVGTPVFTRLSSGSAALDPVRVDNAAFIDNSSHITPVGYIFDEVAGTALTENDAAVPRIDSKRAVINVTEDATVRGQRAAVDATGAQLVAQQAATATLANVAGSASSVTLQASNGARKGLVIVNDSTAILYVKFGSSASTTSFTYYLAGSVSGVPAILELPGMVYTGIVTGIWASAVGSARVTELT